ncbi:MAG: hypothetical protein CL840_08100 [Crocinitomicaceae bacterium]|nr:hypothetical protein [Crocinitomicaceae bacterium]|tara:strand:- start:56452 stop:58818 length:2367 start_codon:yes stop_codon:yes gene_type:complete
MTKSKNIGPLQLFSTILLLCTVASLKAQIKVSEYGRYDSIVVVSNLGDTMVNPWAGGINNAQFTEWDFNKDGKKDLFVFDKDHAAPRIFVNTGEKGKHAYKHVPEYEHRFPRMWNWALMVDYDGDGKEDLFTAAEIGDIRVFRNTSVGTEPKDITFEPILFKDPYDSTKRVKYITTKFDLNPGFIYTNVFNLSSDIPGIVDVDHDGDMDIIAYGSSSNSTYLYENTCKKLYGHADSLLFELNELCWGRYSENFFDFHLDLNACKGKSPQLNQHGRTGSRHEGSTILMRDFDYNGQIDILLGDVSFNKLVMGYNHGTSRAAKITRQDTAYPSDAPSSTIPVDLNNFPAAFYVDANNDGSNNLVVCPNAVSNFSNYNNVHMYSNSGTTQQPVFKLAQKDFLVGEMVEVGSNAFPLLIDIDGDSLNDILVGSFGVWTQSSTHESRLSYYKNTGTKTNPKYNLITRDYLVLPQSQDTGLYPTSGDVDNDGDLDLFIGTDRGNILFYENQAASRGDSVILVHQPTPFDTVVFGKSIRPYLFDIDNDGKLDLLVGSQLSGIKFYKNIGTKATPNYNNNNVTLNWADIYHINELGFGNLSITIADLDTAGKLIDSITDIKSQRNIFVGTSTGSLFRYVGIDSTGINLLMPSLDSVYHYTTDLSISLGDITGDDKLDFIIGQKSGGISALLKDGGNIVLPPPEDTTDTVGVIQFSYNNDVNIYPNPTTGKIYVEFDPQQKLDTPIQIRDLSGRVVFVGPLTEDSSVDLSAFPTGVYWLEISFDNQKQFKKVVKVDQ